MKQPIFWHQGLLLKPQHFQLNDRHHQSMLAPYHQYLTAHLWGTGRLKIDAAALKNAMLVLEQGEFWFREGCHVVLHENAVCPSRTFDPSIVADGKPITVYVGLRRILPAVPNVTVTRLDAAANDAATRYVCDTNPEEVKNLYQKGPTAQVTGMMHNLRLFFGNEIERLDQFELIPIAKLVLDIEQIVLSEDYIPPCYTVAACPALLRAVQEIKNLIASRCRDLEFQKKEKGVYYAEFGSRDMVYLFCLRSMNRYLPMLYALLDAKAHPWFFFVALKQLAGELSTFSKQVHMIEAPEERSPILAAYDHLRLDRCFADILILISKLLAELSAGPKHVIAMVPEDLYFRAPLEPEILRTAHRYYLCLRTEEDPQAVLEAMRLTVKAGTRSLLPTLIEKSLPGITMEYVAEPPSELPRRSGSYFFRLNHQHADWSQVKNENELALYWEDPPPDTVVELMITGQ